MMTIETKKNNRTLKVLQLNVWLDGTKAATTGSSTGMERIAYIIAQSNADIVALSEVKNLRGDFVSKLRQTLFDNYQLTYYGDFAGNYRKFSIDADTAILSKYKSRSVTSNSSKSKSSTVVYRTMENSIVKSIFDIELPSHSDDDNNDDDDDHAVEPTDNDNVDVLRLAVYSIHLEYKCYTTYLPRGYHSQSRRYPGWSKITSPTTPSSPTSTTSSSSSWWKPWTLPAVSWLLSSTSSLPPHPVIDIDRIRQDNIASGRTYAVQKILDDVDNTNRNYDIDHVHDDDDDDDSDDDAAVDVALILGDFNEPSCLDWIDETKHMASHNGLVYEWDTTKLLLDNGYIDSYRQVHPSPVTHPGYTWPAAAATTANATGRLGGRTVTTANINNNNNDDNNDDGRYAIQVPQHNLMPTNWLRESDERDRIDFVFYKNLQQQQQPKQQSDRRRRSWLKPISAKLVGTPYMSVLNQVIDETETRPTTTTATTTTSSSSGGKSKLCGDGEDEDGNNNNNIELQQQQQQQHQQQHHDCGFQDEYMDFPTVASVTSSSSSSTSMYPPAGGGPEQWWPSDHRGVLIEYEIMKLGMNE